MAKYSAVNGVYRKVAKKYDPVDGVYRNVAKAFEPVDGVYRQYFGSAVPVETLAVGESVWLDVDGTLTEFIVIQQGKPDSDAYGTADSSFGIANDGTWLLMKDVYSSRKWNSDKNDITYKYSDIHSYLNGTFYGLLDDKTKSAIKQAAIPNEKYDITGISHTRDYIFLLSGMEVGYRPLISDSLDNGIMLAYFESGTTDAANNKRIAYLNGTATEWWLRSVNSTSLGNAMAVSNTGAFKVVTVTLSRGVRPALILEGSTIIAQSGGIYIIA